MKDKYISFLEKYVGHLEDALEDINDLLEKQSSKITKLEFEVSELETFLNLERAKNTRINPYIPESPYQPQWPQYPWTSYSDDKIKVTYNTGNTKVEGPSQKLYNIEEPGSVQEEKTSKGTRS